MWSPDRRLRRALGRCALAALAWAPVIAWAALGEPVSSTQSEALQHAAIVKRSVQGLVQVHVLQMADGSEVRQYSGPDGIVYMVSWSTRGKPRLDTWLGAHFKTYAHAAAQRQQQQPGLRHALSLEEGDLALQSNGHAQAFIGRAWLRSRVGASAAAALR